MSPEKKKGPWKKRKIPALKKETFQHLDPRIYFDDETSYHLIGESSLNYINTIITARGIVELLEKDYQLKASQELVTVSISMETPLVITRSSQGFSGFIPSSELTLYAYEILKGMVDPRRTHFTMRSENTYEQLKELPIETPGDNGYSKPKLINLLARGAMGFLDTDTKFFKISTTLDRASAE